MKFHTKTCGWFLSATLLLGFFTSTYATAQDEDDSVEEIIVTGFQVTQGGAQDIDYFRGEVAQARIPHPDTITAEGLFSQHNLLFPSTTPCAQLFCLTSEVTAASLITQPQAKLLVGLGFGSNLDANTWTRQPLNLIAVVDKSGSMDGHPLELVRESLAKVTGLLNDKDQISIVLYGDTTEVYLAPTAATKKNKKTILRQIEKIISEGSTAMEAGLRLGYDTASKTSKNFAGNTRVMLFTDERPNVGSTEANTFMGMAIAAAKNDIGLTTIGVGEQFDAELATRISSVRGGNLFFLGSTNDVNNLFERELDFMVSQLAHDLTLTITPNANYAIAGIYGIPGSMLGWQGTESVSVTIPTVFLSSNGGAIFFTLANRLEDSHLPARTIDKALPIANISLSYVSASDKTQHKDSLAVFNQATSPSEGIQLGHHLVDEYTSLYRATAEHYLNNDQESAYQILTRLLEKLSDPSLPTTMQKSLAGEQKLVRGLQERLAFLAGHESELKQKTNLGKLWGTWIIIATQGNVTLKRNDLVTFSPSSEFAVYRTIEGVEEQIEDEEYQANDKQIYLTDSELTFNYRHLKNRLVMRHLRSGVMVRLARVGDKIHAQ
ncbi:vWA domain-containing protein [Cellvibrio sp. OA-2007]|uniref:vWA domain-containing protein n=1 Tax=Cellvibrio sp. OA-2007 TaxID=529823 RepID=UPI0007867076|nr:VWA domain-containing protein [Cellvibrio sp. OA-2007]